MSEDDSNGSNKYPESVGASVSKELKTEIRLAAAKENVSMSTYIRQILQDHMGVDGPDED